MHLLLLLPLIIGLSVPAISNPHTHENETLEVEKEALAEQPIVDEDDCPDALFLL